MIAAGAVRGRGDDRRRGPRAAWWALLLCLGAGFASQAWSAQDGSAQDGEAGEQAVPALRGPVTDLTGTLTPQQAAQIEQRLREFEAQKGSQIAVLLVPTTRPETIEQYSIRVVDAWQLGRKGTDDGVLLLVAKNDRAVRIEVGRGLEGALPDAIANRITDQVIVPRFRQGDFSGGLDEAVTRIIAVVEGEPLPEVEERGQHDPSAIKENFLPLLLMLIFVVGGVLRSMLGSFGGAALTGGLAGLLVWVLTGVVAMSIGAAVIAFLFTIFGGGGSGWANTRRGPGSWSGRHGSGWGGGFGGGVRGGWSGGGGGFGGGGATGRW